MPLLAVVSDNFSRQLFKDGERSLILTNCQMCGASRIATSYDGSLQEWESEHVCDTRTRAASA
jgi:hypothetical protein